MKAQHDKWEADIRQKVEQHEFEYDSMAWAEMDQLLDQTSLGGSTSTTSALKTGLSSWSWWQIILMISISSIVGLLILQWNKDNRNKDTIELSNFSIPESEMLTIEDTLQTIILHNVEVLAKLPPPDIKELENLRPYRLPDDTKINWRSEVLPVLQPLPVSPQAVLREQQYELNGIDSLPHVRKRNPKTLFPDVIENYK